VCLKFSDEPVKRGSRSKEKLDIGPNVKFISNKVQGVSKRENTVRQSQLRLCYFVSDHMFRFLWRDEIYKGKGKGHPKTGHEVP
jgi:hypothetical protein